MQKGIFLFGTQLYFHIAIVRTIAYNIYEMNTLVLKGAFIMAAKTANLYARIEPEVKEQAESILAALGISVSGAINMFYKQIVFQNGLPFEAKLPAKKPVSMTMLTKDEIDAELEKGYSDMKEGKVDSAENVFADIRREYGL